MITSLYIHETAIDRRPSTRATRPDHHECSLPPTAILLRSNHASLKEQMSGGPVEEDQHALFAAIVRSHLADVTELAAERRAAKASTSENVQTTSDATTEATHPADGPTSSSGAPTSASDASHGPPDSTLDEDTLLALELFADELQRISGLLDDHALAQQLAQEDQELAERGAREALQVAQAAEGEEIEISPGEARRRAEQRSAEVGRLADEAAQAYLSGSDEATRARQREFARLVRERIEERDRQDAARRRQGARAPPRRGSYHNQTPARRPTTSSTPSFSRFVAPFFGDSAGINLTYISAASSVGYRMHSQPFGILERQTSRGTLAGESHRGLVLVLVCSEHHLLY